MKISVEKLDYEGRGLSRIDGKVTFIPRCLPKEVVDVSLDQENKNYNVATINSILQKSKHRVPSFCPYASKCGGCTFDITSYEDSLKYKKEILEDLFSKNKLEIPSFKIIPSRPVLGYRNKVSLHVKDFQFGFFREETHDFVPIKRCFLADDTINSLLSDFSMFSFQNGSFMVRVNASCECLLSIETNETINIDKELFQKHNIKGILFNGKCVYGLDFLEERRDEILYSVPATAFFQINPYISEQIVSDVLKFVCENDTLYDLYCGVGFFSLRLSKHVKEVIGIESNLSAVKQAVLNAKINNISNVTFHAGKVEDILVRIPKSGKKVLVDPPRSGLHKKVVHTFLEEDIETILYISCNPITLVRDLNLLSSKYKITFFQGYDMFSYTKHVECVCVLNRR